MNRDDMTSQPDGDRPSAGVRLAVVGVACLFPKADGLDAYWANIKNRVDAIAPVPPTHWHSEDYHDPDPKAPDHVYTIRGGFLEPIQFAPGDFGIAPNDLEAIDTAQLLGLVVAREALADAERGRPFDNSAKESGSPEINRARTGVILGVTGTLELVIPLGARLGHPRWRRALKDAGVSDKVADDVVERIADSYVGWQENSFPGLLGNVVAGRIANRLDLGGTNCVVDAACASSLSALHLAALELQTGRADVMVTGGVDTFNDVFMYMCFSKTPALSPTGDARPFDAAGDGTVLGEGLGMVVLKRLADAERDGNRIYAVICGIGSSSDGKGNAVYAPKAEGQVAALKSAYANAGINPETIELVEAHGTGTRVGDATEVAALNIVYRSDNRDGPWCALGSVKSQIGHTKAAAGAAGLIKAIAALHHKVLPPTIKVAEPLEGLRDKSSPFYVNAEKRPWLPAAQHPRRAAVSAFGFGGSNFHCVLEEADARKNVLDWDGDVQILAFVAESNQGLSTQLQSWPRDLPWNEFRRLASASRATWKTTATHRLLLVVQRDRTDLQRAIRSAESLLKQDKTASLPQEGVYLGIGTCPGKLAILFPGQGAQYPGMLRDLACQFPPFFDTLVHANKAFRVGGRDTQDGLADFIYPRNAFTETERSANEAALRATDIAQPALGAVSLGAWRTFEQFGIHADAMAGHSYGELTALCAAGRLVEPDFHRLSNLRGQLMARADEGAMLAVLATLEEIEAVVREENMNVTLANKNAPTQTVLSGRPVDIERAAKAFSSRRITVKKLSIGGAFHSTLVADAAKPLRVALEEITLGTGSATVFANTTGEAYPAETPAACDLLANQLARPVEFVTEIRSMYDAGVRTFVEVGPGARLTSLVSSILSGREYESIALDASSGQRSGCYDLARVLAHLAALGYSVNLGAWDPVAEPLSRPDSAAKRPTLTMPICGANYVKPRQPRPPASQIMLSKAKLELLANVPLDSSSNAEADEPPVPAVATEKRFVSNHSTAAPADNAALSQALQLTRESLAAVQKIQEQTANLHRQFLEGQESSQRSVQTLIEQQQRLLQMTLGLAAPVATVLPNAKPAIAPVPSAVAARVSAVPPEPVPVAPSKVVTAPVLSVEPVESDHGTNGLASSIHVPVAPPVVVSEKHAPASVYQTDQVASALLDVVAEKTGYPAEMLDLDMALDADLGIDSIKRVEILSALQDRLPGTPEVRPDHLGTFQNLRDIAQFLAGPAETAAVPELVPAVVSAPAAVPSADAVTSGLLEIVAEKTGYPSEMLDLDMALDADLGIDSIKRVEILSALQERFPDAPLVGPEQLGKLHNLRQIADFLCGRSVEAPIPAPSPVVPTKTPATAPSVDPITPTTTATLVPEVTEKSKPATLDRTVLRLATLDASLSRVTVETPPGTEIWIAPDDDELAGCLERQLRRLGYDTRLLAPSALREEELPSELGGLVVVAPAEPANDLLLKDAIRGVQRLSPALRRAGHKSGAVFATVSRLDGGFGLRGISLDREPVDGGLAGLAKTAGHEWPEVHCKAFDVAPGMEPHAAAVALADELFLAGPSEIGLNDGGTFVIRRASEPLAKTATAEPFAPGDVIVISGGARGVTAEIAVALAEKFKPLLVLLGRSPAPKAEPDWLRVLQSESEIKRELATRANGSASPKLVGDQYAKVLAGRETRNTLARIEAAGASAIYLTADVRESETVGKLLEAVRQEYGPIRGIIHGAGVLADSTIDAKTIEQFDLVYSTKVDGLRSLLAAVDAEELRALVLFSSTTARFGRAGQADYAIANEVLNKVARQQARRLPDCRVVSINWGPWDGGMVTPSLKNIFAREGIPLIAPEAGAEFLVQELRSGGHSAVEVVALGGPISDPEIPTTSAPASPSSRLLPEAFERTLELADHPVLESHILDGKPVFPVALMMEWLAHAAMQVNPGLLFQGIDELRVFHGIVLDDGPAPTLRVSAGKAVRRDGTFVAPVQLRSKRDGREILHAQADVVLTTELPAAPPAAEPPETRNYPYGPEEIYRDHLFHGPDFQGIQRVAGCGKEGIIVHAKNSPPPADWLRSPLRQKWLTDPLVIDVSFQALILWSLHRHAAASLPCYVRHYRQFRRSFPDGGIEIVARVTHGTTLHAIADIDFLDADGRVVARIEGYECVLNPELRKAFRRNRLVPAALS